MTEVPAEARAFYDRVLALGHEGVLVKDPAAPYEAGRRGAAWLKVKPAHTLDLVVLAAEWGSGRRRGFLSNLHLGARDPASGGFVMLGKTFKGLTDELLAWQTIRLLALETERHGATWSSCSPNWWSRWPATESRPVRATPAASRCASPACKGYRADKSAATADTIDTVRGLAAGLRGPSPTPARGSPRARVPGQVLAPDVR